MRPRRCRPRWLETHVAVPADVFETVDALAEAIGRRSGPSIAASPARGRCRGRPARSRSSCPRRRRGHDPRRRRRPAAADRPTSPRDRARGGGRLPCRGAAPGSRTRRSSSRPRRASSRAPAQRRSSRDRRAPAGRGWADRCRRKRPANHARDRLVADRRRLPDLPAQLRGQQRRRHRRPAGHPGAPRPPERRHAASLGVDAIWLSPIYPSPDFDFGYDVADYVGVDPRYGTLADFDRLVEACHGRGMRVILDLVLNHSQPSPPLVRGVAGEPDRPVRRLVHLGRLAGPDHHRQAPPARTTGARSSAGRHGRGTRRGNSSTCTRSCPSSPS